QCTPACGYLTRWFMGVAAGAANGVLGHEAYLWTGSLLLLAWFAPNTQEFMRKYRPVLDMPKPNKNILSLVWRPSFAMACFAWLIGFVAIINLTKRSPFLYFQF